MTQGKQLDFKIVSINKVLLEHSHIYIHLHVVYGCFEATMVELSN